jgi:hypothetical protein
MWTYLLVFLAGGLSFYAFLYFIFYWALMRTHRLRTVDAKFWNSGHY